MAKNKRGRKKRGRDQQVAATPSRRAPEPSPAAEKKPRTGDIEENPYPINVKDLPDAHHSDDNGDWSDESDEDTVVHLSKDSFIPASMLRKHSPTPSQLDQGHALVDGKQGAEDAAPKNLFEWLIHPVTIEEFYEEYWEKKPLFICRQRAKQAQAMSKHYYSGWFDRSHLDNMITNHEIKYGRDINVTLYKDQTRHTFDPDERATLERVNKFFNEDRCSIRVLCPQQYYDSMWRMLSLLEEYWGSGAGANVYMTPAGSQGFAPHYDEIEAFVLQTEGAKRWRLYHPRNEQEKLDRFSSHNFSQDEIGKPFTDIVLRPGDLLYFPRGTIHQAVSLKREHSLHITVSTGMRTTWHDYLNIAIPAALQIASEDDSTLRQSLPRDYMNYMGLVHSDREDPRREAFMEIASAMMQKVASVLPFDTAADEMHVNHLHDRLPIPASHKATKKKVSKDASFRLRRANICRMVVAGDNEHIEVYHCAKNSRVYHQVDVQSFTLPIENAEAMEQIICAYPKYLAVAELPVEDETGKLSLVKALQAQGLIDLK